MPKWFHRTTRVQLRSVASADLPNPQSEYIEEPDYSAVEGQPVKYWEVAGDVISLADQATRDAIDLAENNVRKDSLADEVETNDLLRAIAETNLDLFNQLRAFHGLSAITPQQYKANVRGNL